MKKKSPSSIKKKLGKKLIVNNVNSVPVKNHIRFEVNKNHEWIKSDNVLFVKSADHYVDALVLLHGEKVWVVKHCLLKELFEMLPSKKFMRLNKFYVLNLDCNHDYNEDENTLYFDKMEVKLKHKIHYIE